MVFSLLSHHLIAKHIGDGVLLTFLSDWPIQRKLQVTSKERIVAMTSSSKSIEALALSGGGFRAAFFHLGALYGLAQQGRINSSSLNSLVTISGGTVAAAIFLREWVMLCRTQDGKSNVDLRQCATLAFRSLLEFSVSSPRSRAIGSVRALTRASIWNEFGTSAAMQRIYKNWLGLDATLFDKPNSQKALPEWRIGCTEYNSGRRAILVFNERFPEKRDVASAIYRSITGSEITSAMAASTAVPGVFEPIRMGNLELGDGGILDNLGSRELLTLGGRTVCIDASAPLQQGVFTNGWTAPLRAGDLMMEQARDEGLNESIELITLRNPIEQPSQLQWWTNIARTRTDLDAFVSSEASMLYLAGYQSAVKMASIPDDAPSEAARQIWQTAVNGPSSGSIQKIEERNMRRLSALQDSKHKSLLLSQSVRGVQSILPAAQLYMHLMSALAVVFILIYGAVKILPAQIFDLPWWQFSLALWLISSAGVALMQWSPAPRSASKKWAMARALVLGPAFLAAAVVLGWTYWTSKRVFPERND